MIFFSLSFFTWEPLLIQCKSVDELDSNVIVNFALCLSFSVLLFLFTIVWEQAAQLGRRFEEKLGMGGVIEMRSLMWMEMYRNRPNQSDGTGYTSKRPQRDCFELSIFESQKINKKKRLEQQRKFLNAKAALRCSTMRSRSKSRNCDWTCSR